MQHRESSASLRARRIVIISPDTDLAEELRPVLETHLPSLKIGHRPKYPTPREIGAEFGAAEPSLIFLDAASDREQSLHLLAELVRLGPSAQVIVLLAANDPDLILRCLRAGASDFLLRPFTGDQLEGALANLVRLRPAEPPGQDSCRIFAVMPAKGACGATTVAANLAFQWKKRGAKVLLADLDPLAGILSFLLKIKSVYSFLDTLNRAHELDADLWKAMVTDVNGVDVLLAPELLAENPQDLKDPSPILDYARHSYDVIVLDAGSVYGEWNLNQARAATEILLVTTNELPALQAAQRALSYLDSSRIGRWKVKLVVNRYHRDVGLNREVIGTALHTEVFESLPSDYEAIQKSLMEGKPVPAGSPLGKGFIQLAERLGARASTPQKPSGLGGLFGFLSRPSK
jgi:pilus assembly protein CpaE